MKQIVLIIILLCIILCFLGWYYLYTFQQLKKVESKKVRLLSATILSEKNRNYQLKKQLAISNKEITLIRKLKTIKVDIVNIDFTLKELF